jgi:transposase
MRGRKPGKPNLSFEEIETIIKLTKEKYSRPDISKKINKSCQTIYNYQKKFCYQ